MIIKRNISIYNPSMPISSHHLHLVRKVAYGGSQLIYMQKFHLFLKQNIQNFKSSLGRLLLMRFIFLVLNF